MNSKKDVLFTAGQFAKLHNINKRTLIYYDDIGLFSPYKKGVNDYRYYTYLQSPHLEMILALRELDMSIDEIKRYLEDRSSKHFHELINGKMKEIDKQVTKLNCIKQLLKTKDELLTLSEHIDLNSFDIITCSKEYLLLSHPITGNFNEDDLEILMEHTHRIENGRLYNKSYGSMISLDEVQKGDFDNYKCFFTRLESKSNKQDIFMKPEGTYLRGFCKGDWNQLPHIYERMLFYAKQNGLTLSGYAFEEGINEMAIQTMEDYVTLITIKCD